MGPGRYIVVQRDKNSNHYVLVVDVKDNSMIHCLVEPTKEDLPLT